MKRKILLTIQSCTGKITSPCPIYIVLSLQNSTLLFFLSGPTLIFFSNKKEKKQSSLHGSGLVVIRIAATIH